MSRVGIRHAAVHGTSPCTAFLGGAVNSAQGLTGEPVDIAGIEYFHNNDR